MDGIVDENFVVIFLENGIIKKARVCTKYKFISYWKLFFSIKIAF
jgi:hypothetical protein